MQRARLSQVLLFFVMRCVCQKACVTVFQIRETPRFSHLAEVMISNLIISSKSASSSTRQAIVVERLCMLSQGPNGIIRL